MRRWWGHLKLKVLSFGILMSILPLALFGWYGIEAARDSQVEIAQTRNQAAARMVADEVAQFIKQLTLPIQLQARVFGADLVAMVPAERERVLYTLLRDVPYLDEVAVADGAGNLLTRVSRREVTTAAALGTLAQTDLWRKLAAGEPALGAVSLDVDGRPLIDVGVPLPGQSGALVARATLRGVFANIAAVRGNRDINIHVLDEAGRIIGDSDFSLVLSGTHAALPPETGAPYRSVTGEEVLGISAPVPGLAWRVVGETTLVLAMAPVRQLAAEFVGAAAVLVILVVALSVVFGLQLTEPLERLEAGARQVGSGDLSARVPEGGRDELGRLIKAFNAMTQRLEAQSLALQRERDRLDTVVSSIGAGLALIGPGGEVIWVNRTLSDWFPGSLLQRPCWEVLGRTCSGCSGEACPAQPGVEQRVQIHGKPRLIRYSTYQLDEGRLEVLEDVTDRRTMEAAVRQSEKLAAVGQLAAGVAHEINNPLAVISAYAEDLSDRLKEEGAAALEQSGDLHAYLAQLQGQVQRCKGITMNLLSFARRGATAPKPEPVDAGEVARQTAALITPRARKSGVAVRIEAAAGLPDVRATYDQLQQVFLNLMTNALDAMEDQSRGGEIRVTVHEAGDSLHIAVADTGPGMDADTLEHAMEPFFTTKPPGRGTGLGLSTCYGIIAGLGGRMSLASEVGRGTTITFELPCWEGSYAERVPADRR